MDIITAYNAEQMLKKYVDVSRSQLTQSIDDALDFVNEFPVVVKLISKRALHKTEMKAIRIVYSREQLIKNYGDLLKIALENKFLIEGVLVQDFKEGSEVFIGIKKDPTFGHVIGLGVGGVLVEELKDVQWRVCPITNKDADSMLSHLKFKNIIYGTRNNHNNIAELKKALISLSNVPKKYPHLQEMDVNPLILNHKYATVVDARMIFE
jgi:hypothetical protein